TPEDQALGNQVQQLIDDMINPAIASHGGFITLVNVKGPQVFITMGGGCQGCAASKLTLKAGVERMIREELPEVSEVIDITDHTMGDNPYYAQ
ncbi:MAG: NifU family protein, partial [Myxococcales bacterium]|nr:NifU family protein [Myxococcales bacterium]